MIVAIAAPALAAPDTSIDRRSDALRVRLADAIPDEGLRISVVLREPEPGHARAERPGRIAARQSAVLSRLRRGRFDMGHRYRWISGFSGWADAETIESLINDPDVESVDVDRVAYMTLAQGKSITGTNTAHSFGVTGSGVTVAMLDTGIDTNHPHLVSSLVAEACFCDDQPGPNGCCPNNGDTQTGSGSAEDDEGHGTGTSGVIVSSLSTNLGVAPDAEIVALKVLAANGSGSFSDVVDALDWVITHHATYGIKVVNLSLGDGGQYNNAAAFPCTGSNTANAMAQLKAIGISVFTASGNEGHDNGISFPGCVPSVVSVGGVYDATFPSISWCGATCSTILCTDTPASVDTFVCHTNSGALLDVLAPDFNTLVPALGGGTTSRGGTSIASPYAAGMAALILEADPSATPDDILAWLKLFAPMINNPDNGLSFPRARVDVAVQLLLAVCGNGVLELGEECDDANTSPGDCCDAACDYEASASSCDDADLCTLTDQCDGAGGCVGSGSLACDDSNVCTDDSCIPATGCDFAANANACDDANACTNADVCSGGSCTPGPPLACDDSNVCTDDSCIPATGCDFAANANACDDANACTNADVCSGGSCVSGAALDCDDADDCTADGCDGVMGCFNTPIVGCPAPPMVPSSGPVALGLLVGCLALATLAATRAIAKSKPHS